MGRTVQSSGWSPVTARQMWPVAGLAEEQPQCMMVLCDFRKQNAPFPLVQEHICPS